MNTELYRVDVYNPNQGIGRNQYLFFFHFAPQRWTSQEERQLAWWIASFLFEADESVKPGCTKGMLVYLNLVTESPSALPGPSYAVSAGIMAWMALSPDFSQLRNEIMTQFRLRMLAAQIQSSPQPVR